ncbi:MAG: PPOX class F420-dependent oxidoreductase [Candidatus Dormiibacterota bacterium]
MAETTEPRAGEQVDFTPAEVNYLKGQNLARIATASNSGEVDVAPIGLHFNGQTFLVVGLDLPHSFKYRHIKENGAVAMVVDDLASVDPWRPRGVKIHGGARIRTDSSGREIIVVTPYRKWSWGLEQGAGTTL